MDELESRVTEEITLGCIQELEEEIKGLEDDIRTRKTTLLEGYQHIVRMANLRIRNLEKELRLD